MKFFSSMPSMLPPVRANAVIAHVDEGSQDRACRPTATTRHLPCLMAYRLKRLQILLLSMPGYETIADSLAQWLQAAVDTHLEPKEVRIRKRPVAILPAQCHLYLFPMQKEQVAEIGPAVLRPYVGFSEQVGVLLSRIRLLVLAIMDGQRHEPFALFAILYLVTPVGKTASVEDHQIRHQLSDGFRCHQADELIHQLRMPQQNPRCLLLFLPAPHPQA